jgi:hypothetical protein
MKQWRQLLAAVAVISLVSVCAFLVIMRTQGQTDFLSQCLIGSVATLLLSGGAAAYCHWNGQEIPNEPIHAPKPLEMETDQAWRKPSRLRFLERLKQEVCEAEREIRQTHERAVTSYKNIPSVISYSNYTSEKAALDLSETSKHELLQQLPPIYERIERVFCGDVAHEILNIEEEIRKFEREKQEHQRLIEHGQIEASRCNKSDCDKCKAWPDQKAEHYSRIHTIDVRVIELQTDLKELENFDFQRLWRELSLPGPPELGRIPKVRLDDLKAKVETANSIPNLKERGGSQPSAEDIKQKNKAKLEKKISELKTERAQKMAVAESENERRRYQNFYEDAITEAEEQWSKFL